MVWNKSFTVSICVYMRQVLWSFYGLVTIPKRKVIPDPDQGHLAWQFHKQLPLQECVTQKSAARYFGENKRNQTYKIFSPGSLSWQQDLKFHALTALERAQLHGQGWGSQSLLPAAFSHHFSWWNQTAP